MMQRTPRVSLSTTEMIVKELNGGKSNAAFDYIVYGLRIGFEESGTVQPKVREAPLPTARLWPPHTATSLS